jgi:CRP/FNR family cyclic AMP-dependent transcriptional regulator
MSAKEITLKPNDLLFEEGDPSKSLYFVKKGAIRLFRRKGEGKIEIDTVRTGQVLGELAFFDGQPRSASAEALLPTELVEISKGSLDDALAKVPDWLVTLIKTVTSRLRTVNNRVRMLESLSTEYEVDKHGNRSKEYCYITTPELLKFSTALLTVASRYGKNEKPDGIEFTSALLERFASQILQVPSAKVLSLIELMKTVRILKEDLMLTDIRFLDQFIQYLNEQNLTPHEKKQTLSETGFKILGLMIQNRSQAKALADSIERLNIGPAIQQAGIPAGQLQELQDQGFVKNITLVSASEILLDYEGSNLLFLYRVFWVLTEIDRLNEAKRKK